MTTDPVGWAEERSDVPTIYRRSRCEMVGTLRSAHPTASSSSQLPCIRKRERAYPTRVLVQDQRSRDRRLGALAAVFALAEPAVDANRRALRFLQIYSGGIDEFGRMADFATETDRKARLRLRMRRHRPAHHLRDRKIARAV